MRARESPARTSVAEELTEVAEYSGASARPPPERSGTRKPFGSDERDESAGNRLALDRSLLRAHDLDELLPPAAAAREDETAADGELLVERLRDRRRRGRDRDPVERRALRHAERAVADMHLHV